MAKTIFNGNAKSFSEINQFIGNFDKSGGLLSEHTTAEIREWVHTGSYVLNACISGSILKGVPSGRIITISGDPKTGKSFVLLSCMAQLQKKGYFCIYFDTENATSYDRFIAQGVDPQGVRVIVPETVADITVQLTQLTQSLLDTKKEYEQKNKKLSEDEKLEIPKVAVFIDSLSALNSSKQFSDALSGEMKQDMGTVAKEIKLLFNMITPRLGKLDIPMLCTAHEYEADQGYQRVRVTSGGKGITYMASVLVSLRKKFDRDENKQKMGVIVTAGINESRFSIHRPVEFYISFTKGLNAYMGLQEFVSWNICGIDRGRMVAYVDTASEISKKIGLEKSKTYSTKEIERELAQAKKQTFYQSLSYDLYNGYIRIVSSDNTIVLPDLIRMMEQDGFDFTEDLETKTIKDKLIVHGIYSDEAMQKMISSYIDSGDAYMVGNVKLDVAKNQKLKFKKSIIQSISDGSYVERLLEVESEQTQEINEKKDQKFVFTEKFFTERFEDGKLTPSSTEKVCFPTPTGTEWVVRHLNKSFKNLEIFNKHVFTDEILKTLDEKVMIPLFSYRDKEYEDMDGDLSSTDMEELSEMDKIMSGL